jgi:hypothetical protein
MTAGTGIAFPVAETEIGVAIEVTKGTAVAPAFWIPVKSPKYKPDLTLLPDETLQGSMVQVYNLVAGMRYDAHGWDAPPYLDSFPVFVRAELGSTDNLVAAPTSTTVATPATAGATTLLVTATVAQGSWIIVGTGATQETCFIKTTVTTTLTLATPLVYAHAATETVVGLTKHRFSLLNSSAGVGNQPPSLTITDFDGEEWRQMTACQLDELNIKGNGTSLTSYTCTFFGNIATTPSTPSPSFSGEHTPASWTFTALIGGTQLITITDWEFMFKRGVKPIPALTGTQGYFMYFANTLQATAKLTFVEQSGSPQLTQFENGVQQAFDFSLFDVITGDVLNIHCSNAQYKTAELDRTKEYVEVPLEVQFLPTTNDALAGGVSPVLITVANHQTTTY